MRRKNPLRKGRSRAVVSSNIAKLRSEGYPEKQAVAISLKKAELSKLHRRRKKNPSGGFLQNPIVWIAGGGLAAFLVYHFWPVSPPPLTATQAALYAALVAQGISPSSAMQQARAGA